MTSPIAPLSRFFATAYCSRARQAAPFLARPSAGKPSLIPTKEAP